MTVRPRWPWYVVLLLSVPITLYALAYVVIGERMYATELVESFRARPWGILPHAFFGGIALLVGALQFNDAIRVRAVEMHRWLGRIYVTCATITGLAGLYMSFHSFGGWITHLGFALLAIALLTATTQAYLHIKAREIQAHRRWMIRSFALIFAAVTLRIELPLLIAFFGGEFAPAYRIVSWLSWVPNLLWAEWYVRRRHVTELVAARVVA